MSWFRPLRPRASVFRALACLSLLGGLAACAGRPETTAPVSQLPEAVRYQARASHDYTPPGPAGDPWGPYISEAAQKYDVPERWVREVMRQESGGNLYVGGNLTTSPVGAMGLMQVMPDTYDMLQARYGLGGDPYDPHNNILAGTAYLREMYDLYGSPGFLAAYNAGPGRVDDYLTRNRPLPEETRKYVASIGPYIADSFPARRSVAEQFAMNAAPSYAGARAEPDQDRSPEPAQEVAYAPERVTHRLPARMPVREQLAAALPEPPAPPAAPRRQFAQAQPVSGFVPPIPPRSGLHLIQPAMAEALPSRHTAENAGGSWAIQVGAYANPAQAHAAANSARENGGSVLAGAHTVVGSVVQGHNTLYRARLTGLSRDAAAQACGRIHHGKCMVLSPESQS